MAISGRFGHFSKAGSGARQAGEIGRTLEAVI
jgi:hypothetical protein